MIQNEVYITKHKNKNDIIIFCLLAFNTHITYLIQNTSFFLSTYHKKENVLMDQVKGKNNRMYLEI